MTSAVNVKQFLRQTFAELAKAEKIGDYERCLKACSKILKFTPNDLVALHCKVVSLIHLQKFDEILSLLKKNVNLAKHCHFEKAYSEYRLNNTDAALSTLQSADPDDIRCQELLAQLLYRTDKYEESYKLYLSILKNTDDEFDEERKANLGATVSQMSYGAEGSPQKYAPDLSTYEQHYNEACRLCALGQYESAEKVLNKADRLCREVMSEEEVVEEEIEDEVSCIKLMIAYCQQMLGKSEEALKVYTEISKQKPSDITLITVASNNIVSLKKESNLFDARKKMKSCQAINLETKLNHVQKSIICYNNLLVNLHSNQFDQCKRYIDDLRKTYSANAWAALCEAALLFRQKEFQSASQTLQSYKAENDEPQFSDAMFYSALQIWLAEGKISQAIEKLTASPLLLNSCGAQSLLVALCLSIEDRQAAAEFLTTTLEQLEKCSSQPPELVGCLLDECASLYASAQDYKRSAQYLERVRRLKPSDTNVLSRLINIYMKFDAKKAEELTRQLPNFDRLTDGLDVDLLENAEFLFMGGKYGLKKTAKGESTPKLEGDANLLAQKKSKKKKKRKIRLPKNLDPNIPADPERWLPKYERSTYKKRKDKRAKDRDIGRGTQGAVSGAVNEFDSSGKAEGSPTPTSPKPTLGATSAAPGPGPRQQRPAPQKPKKKKKGGKW